MQSLKTISEKMWPIYHPNTINTYADPQKSSNYLLATGTIAVKRSEQMLDLQQLPLQQLQAFFQQIRIPDTHGLTALQAR